MAEVVAGSNGRIYLTCKDISNLHDQFNRFNY